MAVPSKYIQSVVKAAKGRPKSTDWFRDKIKEFGTPKALDLIRDGKRSSRPFFGRLNMFVYGPKLAKKLPYYDTFPLVLPLERYGDGFLGMNFHYLPIPLRMKLLDRMFDFAGGSEENFNENTRVDVTYDDVKKISCVISQSEIPKHLPSFAAGVRNALRRKPRLILVGEARDQETINALLEASLTGHPVYTTVHSNGVAETVRRLVNTFPQEERNSKGIDIIETMRLVIWQRLVPTVDGKRVPLREYLVFDEEIRNELLKADVNHVSAVTRNIVKRQKRTMLDDAKKKHAEGIISDAILTQIERYSSGQDSDSEVDA